MNRKSWAGTLRSALVSGSFASAASTVALAAAGRRDLDDPAAPLNGPSQWVWGPHAAYRDGVTLRHTALGYGIHHLASVFWALFFERMAGRRRAALPAAVATASLACLVDNACRPRRLRPGFEKRLSAPSLFLVYAAFAAGLAAAVLIRPRPGGAAPGRRSRSSSRTSDPSEAWRGSHRRK
jgi:hypothetical protein